MRVFIFDTMIVFPYINVMIVILSLTKFKRSGQKQPKVHRRNLKY